MSQCRLAFAQPMSSKDYLVICGRDSTRRCNARHTAGHPAVEAISSLSLTAFATIAGNGDMLPPVPGAAIYNLPEPPGMTKVQLQPVRVLVAVIRLTKLPNQRQTGRSCQWVSRPVTTVE